MEGVGYAVISNAASNLSVKLLSYSKNIYFSDIFRTINLENDIEIIKLLLDDIDTQNSKKYIKKCVEHINLTLEGIDKEIDKIYKKIIQLQYKEQFNYYTTNVDNIKKLKTILDHQFKVLLRLLSIK